MRIAGMCVALALILFLMYFYLRQTEKALSPAAIPGETQSVPKAYIEHARESVQQLNEATQRTNEAVQSIE